MTLVISSTLCSWYWPPEYMCLHVVCDPDCILVFNKSRIDALVYARSLPVLTLGRLTSVS